MSLVQIGKAVGLHRRHLLRLLARPWSAWRVGQAEAFASCCGLNFWDLRFTPELVRRVRWFSDQDRVVLALVDLLRLSGMPASRKNALEYGKRIDRIFGVDHEEEPKEAECGPHH